LDPELFEQEGEEERILRFDPSLRSDDIKAAVSVMVRTAGVKGLGRRDEADVVERMVRKLAGRTQAQAVERALAVLERLGALRGQADEVLAGGRRLLTEFDLSDEPLRSLAATRDHLDQLGLPRTRLTLDLGLSRGLQYYTGMVFEIDHAGLGSESQLCGGGRYDDLVRALGGRQSTPALGFAFGAERVALALKSEGAELERDAAGEVFVLAAAPELAGAAGRAALALRASGVRARLDVSGRPLRTGMQFADREGFAYVAVVGREASGNGTIRLRQMRTGDERVVTLDEAARIVRAGVESTGEVAGVG
jgi:histidyl-tRNA synthetase